MSDQDQQTEIAALNEKCDQLAGKLEDLASENAELRRQSKQTEKRFNNMANPASLLAPESALPFAVSGATPNSYGSNATNAPPPASFHNQPAASSLRRAADAPAGSQRKAVPAMPFANSELTDTGDGRLMSQGLIDFHSNVLPQNLEVDKAATPVGRARPRAPANAMPFTEQKHY
jgi:hypothetical protein